MRLPFATTRSYVTRARLDSRVLREYLFRSMMIRCLMTALFAFAAPAPALETLPLDSALRAAVEHNFDLVLAHDQRDAAAAAREGAKGAFLPSASAGVNASGSFEGGAPSTTAEVSASWNLFDGFRDWNGYRRLRAQSRAAALSERLELESMLETVIVAYYDVVQLKQRLAAIGDLLAVSGERARLAQAKLEVGAGSKLEQLQALADLNQDSSAWLDQNLSLERAKVRLNQLLARDVSLDFDVADSIPLAADPPLEEWRAALSERNAAVTLARARKTAAAAGLDEARGGRLPSLDARVSWSAAPEAFNPDGAVGRDGASYGINMSIPLFDRFATRTNVKRARIDVRSSNTRVTQAETQAAADFEVARRQYALGRRRIALEERNLTVARLQAEAARERYKLGASSPLEFRDAQTRLLDAEGRLITARQSAKQAEAALQRISGALVRAAPETRAGAERK